MSFEPSLLATAGDAELLAGVRSSELDCLQELYRRHVDAVLGLAQRMGLDRKGAEDVAFGLFITLWDDPDTVARPGVPLGDSLLEQARLVCSTMLAARESPPIAEPDRFTVSLDDPRLDAGERDALEMALQGTDYREIAEMLGRPETVVRALLSSALGKLSE